MSLPSSTSHRLLPASLNAGLPASKGGHLPSGGYNLPRRQGGLLPGHKQERQANTPLVPDTEQAPSVVAAAVEAVAGKAAASVAGAVTSTASAVAKVTLAPVAAVAGVKVQDEPVQPPVEETAPATKSEPAASHAPAPKVEALAKAAMAAPAAATAAPHAMTPPKLSPPPNLSVNPIAAPRFVPKALPDLPAYMLRSAAAATKLPDL